VSPRWVERFERLEHAAARSLISVSSRLPDWVLRRYARVVDGACLHPEVQLLLALRELTGQKSISSAASPAEARASLLREARVHRGLPIPVRAARELSFAGPAGPLAARHYTPHAAGKRPLLVFFHGGGFVTGDLDTHDAPCRALCRELSMHVLSVAYRLAPEHPFPAAIDDARASLRYAQQHAAALGADPEQVLVGGDSAGANLATVIAQLAARAGDPLPVLQLLIYPTVDSTVERRSMELFSDGFFLTRGDILWFRRHYLGGRFDLADPRVSPLLAPDLSGLPPAIVITAGFDPLRDEGEDYVTALRAAGSQADLHRVPDLIHGFINMGSVSPASHRALMRVAGLVNRRLSQRAALVA
jgi:acetyl esterase